MTPEICLWRAVVLEALWTACGDMPPHPTQDQAQYRRNLSDWRKEETEKRKSRHWLLNDQDNFATVCQYAAWDPVGIRRRARALATCGWPKFVNERPDFAAECLAEDVDADLEPDELAA